MRRWIRASADAGDLRRISTTYRHDGRGYGSLGFPVPAGTFTATLVPGDLPTLDVPGFSEEVEVVVEEGQFVARHAFWLFGLPFLVLHYRMHRNARLAAGPAV